MATEKLVTGVFLALLLAVLWPHTAEIEQRLRTAMPQVAAAMEHAVRTASAYLSGRQDDPERPEQRVHVRPRRAIHRTAKPDPMTSIADDATAHQADHETATQIGTSSPPNEAAPTSDALPATSPPSAMQTRSNDSEDSRPASPQVE